MVERKKEPPNQRRPTAIPFRPPPLAEAHRSKFSPGKFALSEQSKPKGSPPAFSAGWHTYLLICEDSSYYVGSTNNLAQRIKDHATGKGSTYTKAIKPVILAWYEPHQSREAAQAREKQIKKWSREKKNHLAKGDNPQFHFGVRPWLKLRDPC